MKKTLLGLFTFLLCNYAFSQNSIIISGLCTDNDALGEYVFDKITNGKPRYVKMIKDENIDCATLTDKVACTRAITLIYYYIEWDLTTTKWVWNKYEGSRCAWDRRYCVTGTRYDTIPISSNTTNTSLVPESGWTGGFCNPVFNTLNWTGATDTNWNVATNWELNIVPNTSIKAHILNTSNQPVSSGNISVNALIIDANASLTISPTYVLKVENTIANSGQIIFKSDATGSASFDEFNGTITGAGTATVERYIPAKRAYRFLSSSVTTDTSILDNWQESGTSVTGFGTHITGTGGAANGFDATVTNNPSLFIYSNSAWESITNTDSNTLQAGTAYRLMVRGDRTTDLTTNIAIATPTVLRANGKLTTGNFTPDLNQNPESYTFIGNPFQAPVDIKAVLNASTNMISDIVYYWDPTINIRGAYVTRTLGSINQNSITSDFNEILQSGQAVFVKKANTTDLANIMFTENNKSIVNAIPGVFKTTQKNTNTYGLLRVNLQATENNNWKSIEGALAIFDNKYSWDVTEEDAGKMANLDEEVSFVQNNTDLAIACQSKPNTTDELQLKIRNIRQTNYQWQFELSNYEGETPYLLDTQNNSISEIKNGTIIPFTANASLPNQYKIVFQNKVLSTPEFQNQIVFYPNPGKSGSSFYIQGITEAKVSLYSVSGKKIPVQTVVNGNSLQVTPTNKVSQGVYFVNINQAGKTTQIKWIVE